MNSKEQIVVQARPSIKTMISTCTSMATLFEEQLDFVDEMALVSIVSEVFLQFSYGEEMWLEQKTQLNDECFDKVNIGSEMVKDFVMHSLGVQLTHSFGMTAGKVFRERLRLILIQVQKFQEISAADRATILQANVLDGYSIFIAKICCSSVGMEQKALTFGRGDNELYGREFEHIVGKTQLQPVNVRSMNGDHSIMSPETEAEFNKLVQSIGSFVLCETRFKELLMLTLLNNDYVQNKRMGEMHKRYFTAMHRRYADSLEDADGGGGESATLLLASWKKTMKEVKLLAQMMFKYFIEPGAWAADSVANSGDVGGSPEANNYNDKWTNHENI